MILTSGDGSTESTTLETPNVLTAEWSLHPDILLRVLNIQESSGDPTMISFCFTCQYFKQWLKRNPRITEFWETWGKAINFLKTCLLESNLPTCYPLFIWGVSQGCQIQPSHTLELALTGSLEQLIEIRDLGAPWHPDLRRCAVPPEMELWAKENGCPDPPESHDWVEFESGHPPLCANCKRLCQNVLPGNKNGGYRCNWCGATVHPHCRNNGKCGGSRSYSKFFSSRTCKQRKPRVKPVVKEDLRKVRVLWDFPPESDHQLDLHTGDIVEVTQQWDEWWFGVLPDGRQGCFPAAFVEKIGDWFFE